MKINTCGSEFFGRHLFNKESRQQFKEKWNKMTDQEKIEFMNKRIEACDEHEDRFSVEAMDARCEKWMNMTTEEKEQFLNERKQAFHERSHGMHPFFRHMHS